MTDVAPCGCLEAKFDSCNSLLSSVHTLLVNILQCVRLYIKRKYLFYFYLYRTALVIEHSSYPTGPQLHAEPQSSRALVTHSAQGLNLRTAEALITQHRAEALVTQHRVSIDGTAEALITQHMASIDGPAEAHI